MIKLRRTHDEGFTLIEMLVVVLMVAILAAAGALYYGAYAKNARVAEAIAYAGSTLTAAQACAYSNPASEAANCTLAKLATKIGIDGTTSLDGRWDFAVVPINLDETSTPPSWVAGSIKVTGVAGKDTENMAAGIFLDGQTWVTRCKLDGTAVVLTSPTC